MQESGRSVFPVTQTEYVKKNLQLIKAVPLMISKAFPLWSSRGSFRHKYKGMHKTKDTTQWIHGSLQGMEGYESFCFRGHPTAWDTPWEWGKMQNLDSAGLVSRSWRDTEVPEHQSNLTRQSSAWGWMTKDSGSTHTFAQNHLKFLPTICLASEIPLVA